MTDADGAVASDPAAVARGGAAGWRRFALGGAGGMFVGMGLGRFSYSAMVPALIEAGVLTAVEAGRVGMANLAGFFIGAVISLPLVHRVRRGRVLLAAVLFALGLLAGSALPMGFAGLVLVRGLLGVSTALIMVLALALIAETAPAGRRAEAAGYVFAGVGLGILASAALVPVLLAQSLALTWVGLAAAGLCGTGLALWGWRDAPEPLGAHAAASVADALAGWPMRGLLLAHALFSIGIVPHTLYWVDFIVRGRAEGIAAGGLHWSLVGAFAVLGPFLTAILARQIGTAWALVVAFVALAIGVGAPADWPIAGVLLASSMLFGAQPGLSSLMAARARDLAEPAAMGRVMRAMILANATGGVIGGLLVPWLYGRTGRHEVLFQVGSAALLIGAICALPVKRR